MIQLSADLILQQVLKKMQNERHLEEQQIALLTFLGGGCIVEGRELAWKSKCYWEPIECNLQITVAGVFVPGVSENHS